jgi:hypothetical protein
MKKMSNGERAQFVGSKIMEATANDKTMEDLTQTLLAMSYTLGSLTCEFPKDKRPELLLLMCEMVGKGHMDTSKGSGEPSDLEIIRGHRD